MQATQQPTEWASDAEIAAQFSLTPAQLRDASRRGKSPAPIKLGRHCVSGAVLSPMEDRQMTMPTSTTRAPVAEQMALPEVPTVPPIEPAMPTKGTDAYTALMDLVGGPITTYDWVVSRRNWKLGDAVHRLKKLGWHWWQEMVLVDGHRTAKYHLAPAHAEIAARKLEALQ